MTDLLYVLALLKVEGVGDVVAKKLLNSCGTAENVFKSKPQMLKRIDGIGEVLIKNIQDKSIFKIAEHEMRFIEDEKIQLEQQKLLFDSAKKQIEVEQKEDKESLNLI